MSTRDVGSDGEDEALAFLEAKGYRLVERNYRTRRGEIDLVLRDGAEVVFVEVKLRRGVGFGHPLEAVTARKVRRVRAAAVQYLAERRPDHDGLRFDVVGILRSAGRTEVFHIRNAF